MKKVVVISIIILIIVIASVHFLRQFGAGSYCTTLNYEFALDGTALTNKIQQVKKEHPQWNILEKRDSVYCEVDSCWSDHINHYSLWIFNRVDTCVIYCDINLGNASSPSDVKFNCISILSYYFPDICESSSDGLYSDGTGKFFWKDKNPIRVDVREPNEMQKRAQASVEAFFELIGPFRIVK